MIVWLNGAFGVGKTTVARELAALLPAARVSDPERIGYVMRRTLWRGVDYQDVVLWRRLARLQVSAAGRRGTAIVPMTVVDPEVLASLTGGARVFLLDAPRDILEARIAGSDEAQEWRRSQIDRCLAAFEGGGFGERIATKDRTPTEVARAVAERLPLE